MIHVEIRLRERVRPVWALALILTWHVAAYSCLQRGEWWTVGVLSLMVLVQEALPLVVSGWRDPE